MNARSVELLSGPYRPPSLRRGQKALCLYRDAWVLVTGWTDARISWPRGLLVGQRGHPSILVDEELSRAIRCESAAALRHWWGVSAGVVWRWRKAFQVDRTNNPGSQRLIRAASEVGASVQRGQQLPPEQVARRRQTALELNLGAYLRTGYHGPRWSEEQLALLGTADDEAVAALVGRTTGAVRSARRTRGIPTFRDRRSSRGQRNALG